MLKFSAYIFLSFLVALFTVLLSSMVLTLVGLSHGYTYVYAGMCGDAAFLAYYVYMRKQHQQLALFPLLGDRPIPVAVLSLLLAITGYLVIVAGIGATHGAAHLGPDLGWSRVVVICFVVLAAATEEVICRSYLFVLLRRYMGLGPTMLLTALVFTLLHFPYVFQNPLEFFADFALSLCLSTLTVRFGSLLPATIVHAVLNSGATLVRLGVEAPLNQRALIEYENGDASNNFLAFELAITLMVALFFWRQIAGRERGKSPTPRSHEALLD